MTELEMTKLGRWRFRLQLEKVIRESGSENLPREMIGFEAANAASNMEQSLGPEDKVAYSEGINYALQEWITLGVGYTENGLTHEANRS